MRSRLPRAVVRPWYDSAMVARRKISLSLDADLVTQLEKTGTGGISSQVNDALRAELEQRHRREALAAFLDQYWADHGPPDQDEEQQIERLMRALGSDRCLRSD